jgi:hypothetical protein
MQKRRVAAAVASTLALTFGLAACSTAPLEVAAPTPTPTQAPVDPNRTACSSFENTFLGLGDLLENPDLTEADWNAYRDQYDSVALVADGDVKTRLLALVEEWPAMVDVLVAGDVAQLDEVTMPVARACSAAGFPTQVFALAGA